MIDLVFLAFIAAVLVLGLRRPFLWVLLYVYIDVLSPQRIGYGIIQSVPVSLIAFVAAFAGWLVLDNKAGARFTYRQGLLLALLLYCWWSMGHAAYPEEAQVKWDWVWKALVFALFLPLTITTRLRFEALALTMVLSAAAIVIGAGIKTATGGGGYGSLYLLVNDNSGIYESSTLATVAIAVIPLALWLAKHGTIFPPDWRVKLFTAALVFACLLVPVGTEARTGLICIAVLGVLSLRDAKRRFTYLAVAGLLGAAALPFLPASYYERMATITQPSGDASASTRVAVWEWTIDYAAEHPFGGGFDAYRANSFEYDMPVTRGEGNTVSVQTEQVVDKARAYHSAVFEMLGEQGYPGLALWLFLHFSGVWQMERLRRRWRGRVGPREDWQAPLATALQYAQVIYLVGSLFQGIAYQPFILMLVGMQCALWSYCRLTDSQGAKPRRGRPAPDAPERASDAVTAGRPALR